MQLEFTKTKSVPTGRNTNMLGEFKELSPPKTLRLERMANFKKRAQSSNNVMSLQVKKFNYQPTIEEEDGSSKELRGKKGIGKNMSSNQVNLINQKGFLRNKFSKARSNSTMMADLGPP
jgi:hypothetical protein